MPHNFHTETINECSALIFDQILMLLLLVDQNTSIGFSVDGEQIKSYGLLGFIKLSYDLRIIMLF